jgi:hypothetical protein
LVLQGALGAPTESDSVRFVTISVLEFAVKSQAGRVGRFQDGLFGSVVALPQTCNVNRAGLSSASSVHLLAFLGL